jgi:hypothetical protein
VYGTNLSEIFEVVAGVEKEPSVFLGGSSAERGTQLRNLEALLHGYDLAGAAEDGPGDGLLVAFGFFLSDRYGWEESPRPIAQIRSHSASDAEAWERVWTELRAFRRAVRRSRDVVDELPACPKGPGITQQLPACPKGPGITQQLPARPKGSGITQQLPACPKGPGITRP